MFDEGRDTDKARSPAEKVTTENWLLFKQALTSQDFTWKDKFDNWRRHSSLQHWRDITQKRLQRLLVGTPAAQQQNAADIERYRGHLRALEEVLTQTRWSIKTLLAKVVERFKLRARPERFKPTRPKGSAQRLAKMLRAEMPMVEMLYTVDQIKVTEAGTLKGVPEHKIIKTVAPQSKYQRMASGKQKLEPLYFDEGAFHITANIDGASVFVDGAIDFGAETVYYEVRHLPLADAHANGLRCASMALSSVHSSAHQRPSHAWQANACAHAGGPVRGVLRPARRQERNQSGEAVLPGHHPRGLRRARCSSSQERHAPSATGGRHQVLVRSAGRAGHRHEGAGGRASSADVEGAPFSTLQVLKCQLLACVHAPPQPHAAMPARPTRGRH